VSLVFNVFTNYIRRYFISNTTCEISIIPQLPSPQLFPYLRKFFEQFPCRYAFHYLHYPGRRILGWRFDKYVYMVFHHFHRVYIKFVFICNVLKYFFQIPRYFRIEDMLAVFRRPYQMILYIVNCVLGCPKPHTVFYSSLTYVFTRAFDSLTASHFHPRSKLWGIQWPIL
jgi:hypothetical protein